MTIQFRPTDPSYSPQPQPQPHADPLPVQTRWAGGVDHRVMVEIDRHTVNPIGAEALMIMCRARSFNALVAVLPKAQRVVGCMVYKTEARRFRIAYIAVHPDFRLRGVGEALVDRLLAKLDTRYRRVVACDAPDDSDYLGLHLFLQKCGFVATGIDDLGSINFRWRLEI